MQANTSTPMFVSISVHTHICVHLHMHRGTYKYIHVYIHIYIYVCRCRTALTPKFFILELTSERISVSHGVAHVYLSLHVCLFIRHTVQNCPG